MELIGCLISNERMEMSEAAKNYDDDYCKTTCPHHDVCRVLQHGAERPAEEADFRYHEKIDNEGP
jgi:hypothetical protein